MALRSCTSFGRREVSFRVAGGGGGDDTYLSITTPLVPPFAASDGMAEDSALLKQAATLGLELNADALHHILLQKQW